MRRLASLMVVALLAGCATPDREGPPDGVAPPTAWSAATDSVADIVDPWKRSFDDPRLTEIVTTVLQENFDLKRAATAVDRAVASATMEGADSYPTLSGSLSASRQKQNFIGLPIPSADGMTSSTTADKIQALLSASWELDLWGRVRSARKGATKLVEAAEADYRAARLSLAAVAAKSWFALIEAEGQATLAEERAMILEESFFWANRRFAAGVLSADALRAALRTKAQGKADWTSWSERRLAARRRLELLMARYPAGRLTPAESPLPTVQGSIAAGAPSDLLLRRPDLVAARARLEASDHRLRAARAALFPRMALTASGGRSTDEFSRLNDGDFSVWSLAANLTQPIFQGGRLAAGVDLADATVRQEAIRWASAVLAAFDEVEGGLTSDRLSADRAEAVAVAADQSKRLARTASARHRTGLISYLELLSARRTALEGASQSLAAQRERLDRRVDLIVALGGGFPIDTKRTTP